MPSKSQLLDRPKPRRFQLYRRSDTTGMSGTGIVAEGIVFRDGYAAYKWLTCPSTLQVAESVEDIQHIHGHGGKTQVRYLDDPQQGGEVKTITEVYEDRNRLATAFTKLAADHYPAGWCPDQGEDADAGEWAICWAELPTGSVSWHVPTALAKVADIPRVADDYDGYDREEKNDRLLRYAAGQF